MLYGKPTDESAFIRRMSQPEHFNAEMFFTLIPDILDSVLDDSNMQKNFEGFFSDYMMNLINVNSSQLGASGVQRVLELCENWEKSLGKDRESRLGTRHDWGVGKEYKGFKNSLQTIISYSH